MNILQGILSQLPPGTGLTITDFGFDTGNCMIGIDRSEDGFQISIPVPKKLTNEEFFEAITDLILEFNHKTLNGKRRSAS